MPKPSRKVRGRVRTGPAKPEAFFTQQQADAARQAETEAGNPDVIVRTFTEGFEPEIVEGYEIPVIGLGRYLLIESIKSPVLKPGGWQEMTNHQLAELIFVTLSPEKLSRSLLAQGDAAFADAVADFSDKIPLTKLCALSAAIGRSLNRAFATIIAPASKKKEEVSPAVPGA